MTFIGLHMGHPSQIHQNTLSPLSRTEKNEKNGIVIGLHACAMTLTAGTPTTPAGSTPQSDLNLLSPAICGS